VAEVDVTAGVAGEMMGRHRQTLVDDLDVALG